MSDDLIAFLRDRLDDDERVAQRVLQFSRESYARAGTEAWVADRKVNNAEPPYFDYRSIRTERPGTIEREILRLQTDFGGLTADHIARFASPRRVLAEVNASRRLLDWLVDCESKALDGNWWNLEVEDAFKALAQPYASHPDFSDEWRLP